MPGGNVMEVVCKPTEGREWTHASAGFHDAWVSCGFDELMGADEWFGESVGSGLLASRRAELFEDEDEG